MTAKFVTYRNINSSDFKVLSSPVLQFFEQNIQIERNTNIPIYIQITQQIIQSIQIKSLLPGTKLPGTRALSNVLKINRNTLVAVYEELQLQGWIKIEANKGAFVLHYEKKNINNQESVKQPFNGINTKSGFDFFSSHVITSPYERIETPYYFTDGTTDPRIYPTKELGKWYSYALKHYNSIYQRNINISSEFTQQLSNYLNLTRNLKSKYSNLATSHNFDTCLYAISQLLFKKEDVILIGENNHYKTNMIFQQAGAKLITVPVEEDGIDVNYIRKHFKKNELRAVYCKPMRHYPTNVSLSAKKRIELLELAQLYNFIIIEDDADYDLQYNNTQMLPIASADNYGRVIYLGKFGQTFSPAFETGFVVATDDFILYLKDFLEMLSLSKDHLVEYAIKEMIKEGEIFRLQKKALQIYKERRDLFCDLLKKTFQSLIDFKIPNGGLAIWIKFHQHISLIKLSKITKEKGLTIPFHVLYQQKNLCALRLGYAHLSTTEIQKVIFILHESYQECVGIKKSDL